MATDTAPAPAAQHPGTRRNFWQLPVFVAGVAAAVAAYTAFPPPPEDAADRTRRDLAALRPLVDKRAPDVSALSQYTLRVSTAADKSADLAPLAHLLAGCGFVALAEHGPPETAADEWASAVRHFAKVDAAKLADPADQQRLAFRQAKAVAATGGGDPKALFAILSKPPVGEDDGGERPRLLADVCQKMSPPDLKRARTELGNYLKGPTHLPPAAVARLKLNLANLHVSLNEPADARSWLRDLSAGPADVQAASREVLARLAASENNWAEAVKMFEAALSMPGLPADRRGAVRYQMGLGLLQLKNPTAAATCFEQTLKDPGPVAAAAAVRLAEITVRAPDGKGKRGKAVDLLETATRDAKPGTAFANPFVPVAEVQAAFEEVIQVCLVESEFAAAARAVTGFAKVAAGGREIERRAEVNAAWAGSLLQTADGAVPAAAKLKDAGADYASLARTHPTPTGKADLFRRAADCFRKAGDTAAALAALDEVTKVSALPPETTAAAWLDRGEILLAAQQFPEAEAALQKAIDLTGPAAAVARVKLALVHVENGRAKLRAAATPKARDEAKQRLDLGGQLLAQVANRTTDVPAERDAQQQALFELGKLQLLQQNYPDAEARFRQLIQVNPGGPLANQARLYLGSCLLLLARGDHQGGRPPADADRKLADAQKLFEALAETDDPYLRTQADIRLANTTFLLKKFDDMPALCEKLANRYRGKVEELIVLSMLYSANRTADRPADAARTLARMEEAFTKLTDADFPGGADEYTRDYWKKQWFDLLKGMK